ncbi:MAG: hypothetical protein OXI96_00455 [Acidimicrobiaceae bacterium]|nr:hypothetical protein [Acidimicrobiaceae bacterium]
MAILFLRNVPDHVIDRLKALAIHERRSVSETAVHELDKSTRLAEKVSLLLQDDPPDLDVSVEEMVQALDEARSAREAYLEK